jgi:hypothetical protein
MTWAPDYVTAANVASYLRVTDNVDDTWFTTWASASSRAVDRACNRQFGQLAAPAARVYRRRPAYNADTGLWVLEVDDFMDTTGMLINGVAYASSGVTLLPDNAAAEGRPWTRIGFTSWPVQPVAGSPVPYTITARWGWSAVPSQVPAACYLQCARWNFRRDAPAGVAGSPDQGSEIRLLARLDPDVATTLTGLARPRRSA